MNITCLYAGLRVGIQTLCGGLSPRRMSQKLVAGIDASTQQLKFVAIELDSLRLVKECVVNFDKDLPQYG